MSNDLKSEIGECVWEIYFNWHNNFLHDAEHVREFYKAKLKELLF